VIGAVLRDRRWALLLLFTAAALDAPDTLVVTWPPFDDQLVGAAAIATFMSIAKKLPA
jgi:hypothetical protein